MKEKHPVSRITLAFLGLILFSCSGFPSGRAELSGKQAVTIYWVLEGAPGAGNSQMLLERYYLPTSLATLLWTGFTVRGDEVQLDTRAGYRVVSKRQVLSEPLGGYTVYGYDLSIDVTSSPPAPRRSSDSFSVSFSYREAAAERTGVLPQPLEQALIEAIRKSGRDSGTARVQSLSYRGSGLFAATVLVGG